MLFTIAQLFSCVILLWKKKTFLTVAFYFENQPSDVLAENTPNSVL